MLTIEEIKNISFRRSGKSGYNAEDVDNFIDEVVQTIQRHDAEKADIMKKIEILAAKIEKYRADEEVIRNALLRSERIAEDTVSEAKKKAEDILSQAQQKSDSILFEANQAVLTQKDELIRIKNAAAEFRSELLNMYKEQVKLISEIPDEESATKTTDALEEKYAALKNQNERISNAKTAENKNEPVQADKKQDVISSDTEEKSEGIKRISLTPPAPEDEDVQDEIEIQKTQSFSLKSSQESKPADDKSSRKEKRQRKFSVLKFGDNYDVDDE